MFIARNTAKSQVAAIYRKLSVASRDEAVRRARETGLLPVGSELVGEDSSRLAAGRARARRHEYTKTQTTFPSDSFPGMVAQLTGAGPGKRPYIADTRVAPPPMPTRGVGPLGVA